MFDPIAQSLRAVSVHSPYAAPFVFSAGVATSLGPCAAPRFVAAAGLGSRNSRARTLRLTAACIFGLASTYALFGAASPLLTRAAQLSPYTYIAVSCALAVCAIAALWREESDCRHTLRNARPAGIGAAFLLGASFALVVSPCCTPLLLAVATYGAATGNAAYSAAMLACFALGHAVPIAAAALGAERAAAAFHARSIRSAATVVSAGLMLALAGYYAVLA